jgi:hypothetical protein
MTKRGDALDAPIYPPAAAFEQPIAAPYGLRLEDVSLAELMKVPAAWDIVLKHLPWIELMTGAPMMKPHLGNMTVHSLASFGMAPTPQVLAAIDEGLAGLPVKESTP